MFNKKKLPKRYSKLIKVVIFILFLILNFYFLNKITSSSKAEHSFEENIRN